jgi:hypothetical protein
MVVPLSALLACAPGDVVFLLHDFGHYAPFGDVSVEDYVGYDAVLLSLDTEYLFSPDFPRRVHFMNY